MKYTIKSYGIAKDIVGGRSVEVETTAQTVGELRLWLKEKYPELVELNSLMIAVNKTYAEDVVVISGGDEIVLIPPVSGG